MKLAVVTASVDPDKTRTWWSSWGTHAQEPYELIHVINTPGGKSGSYEMLTQRGSLVVVQYSTVLGPVPAFQAGVIRAAQRGADVIACLHDDLEIREDGWDRKVIEHFDSHPDCGLAGFGGAKGLGEDGIYEHEYKPQDLVRKDFISNMEGAELHGRRVTEATEVACLDGFSQIGRAAPLIRAFRRLRNLGVVHHAYDSALGAYFRAWDWKVWMLPIRCHHAGGQTAVGDVRYQEWLASRGSSDQAQWEISHRLLYNDLQHLEVLPIRVE